MEILFVVGAAIVIFVAIAYSNSNKSEANDFQGNVSGNKTGKSNSPVEHEFMTAHSVGAMLEDENELDPDKGWFGKGFEEEFNMDQDSGNGQSYTDDLPDSSTFDSSDSSDGGCE